MTKLYKQLFPFVLQLGCDVEKVSEMSLTGGVPRVTTVTMVLSLWFCFYGYVYGYCYMVWLCYVYYSYVSMVIVCLWSRLHLHGYNVL